MNALRKIVVALVVVSFAALSAVALTACADDESEQVELSVTESDLSPRRVEVRPGDIEFVVKNDGERLHAFAVETPDGIERTDDIKPGEEARLTVTLSGGRYRMYDPRGDYRVRGVRGTVVVVTSDDTSTVTERTVEERTVEEDTPEPRDVDEPPVTVTERQVQPPPRPRPRRAQPPPPPPPTVPEQVPAEPPSPTPPSDP